MVYLGKGIRRRNSDVHAQKRKGTYACSSCRIICGCGGYLALELRSSDQEEATLYFNKAVGHYQEYLKTKNDMSVLVDLATVAYYGKDNATAEAAFQKAIQLDSKYYQAHYNYGVFLFHSKNDFNGAIQEWKAALDLNPSSQDVERLKSLISGLEKEIAAGQGK